MGLTVEIAQHAPVTILPALDVKECLQITKVENKVLPSVHSGLLDPLNVTIQLRAIIRRIVRSLLGDICPNCLEPGTTLVILHALFICRYPSASWRIPTAITRTHLTTFPTGDPDSASKQAARGLARCTSGIALRFRHVAASHLWICGLLAHGRRRSVFQMIT